MNAWDRRPQETDPAWDAFAAYRDMGRDRSIASAVKKSGKRTGNERQWEAWSSRHDWRSRATAWDMHLDTLIQRRTETAVQKRAEELVKLAANLRALPGLVINEFVRRQKPGTGTEGRSRLEEDLLAMDAEALGNLAARLARAAEAGTRMDGPVLGAPSARLEHTGPDGGPVAVRVEVVDVASLPAPPKDTLKGVSE